MVCQQGASPTRPSLAGILHPLNQKAGSKLNLLFCVTGDKSYQLSSEVEYRVMNRSVVQADNQLATP